MNPRLLLVSLLLVILATPLSATEALPGDVMSWDKTPEAYFMTPEERSEWATTVFSPEQAKKFIAEFHRKRGAGFATYVRERALEADKRFPILNTQGSLSQRGRVWIVMGSPSRSVNRRSGLDSGSVGQNLLITEWTYDADLLPAELGRKSFMVRFQTDLARGYEVIDNVGSVEPYLTQIVTYLANRYASEVKARTAAAPAPAVPDPLWDAKADLNGAWFTGDSFLSPTEEPFYAYSFFLPKDTAAWEGKTSGVRVTLVRDAAGTQIVAQREAVPFGAYDEAGNRFLDHAVALAPGKYDGLFAIYAADGTTLLTSHRTLFEVAAKDVPRATSLQLTSHIDVLESQTPLDPFTFVATKYAVRGDRRFRPADKLAFFTVVANPAGMPAPKLMQKMTFKRDGKDFARTPLEPVQLTQTGPNTFLIATAFDPDSFPAGHYWLELQVRDMNAPEGSELKTRGYALTTEFDVVP